MPSRFEGPRRIWNCWSNNLIYEDGEPGYIIHAFDIDIIPSRALCGVQVADSGMLNLAEFEPGCIRCRRILRKLGLMSELRGMETRF